MHANSSPASAIPAVSAVTETHSEDPLLQWDDEYVLNQIGDWDSVLWDLELHDESSNSQFQHFSDISSEYDNILSLQNPNQNFGNYLGDSDLSFGFDFIDELIRAAECFELNELQLMQLILARLNQRLKSPSGKPLQRAAFYFKEALLSLLSGGSNRPARSSSLEIVHTIRAYKAFSGISPVPMFANFTANQAVLEAVDGSAFVHIIDFDIGLGGHWPSFMKEIADRYDSSKTKAPVIRISAIVTEEYAIETMLIRDNLSQFAEELKIRFHIEFILLRNFEVLSFKSIKFIDGEKLAVNLSPFILRRLGESVRVSSFLSDLRRISPDVVVFVDCEGWIGSETTSFRQSFIEGLEFYSSQFESLDAAGVGGSDWVKKIEAFVLQPKILSSVSGGFRNTTSSLRDLFSGSGMRPLLFSQFAEFQAECLLRRAQLRGFHLAKRHTEMLLCWQERVLVSTSAWRW
ncbi:Transcription factor GRAS [Dillenia turbinata]|uniref:Transcription factor GRAS n=1 Tax=Dillenia turbinata TaxID=194707 RepID=A0AAN8UT39_9MAGN